MVNCCWKGVTAVVLDVIHQIYNICTRSMQATKRGGKRGSITYGTDYM